MLNYVDKHRQELKRKYDTFEKFAREYKVPSSLTDSIFSAGKTKKLEPKDDKELKETLDELVFTLKSTIAYDLWDRNEYFKIINERNDIVQRALQYLKEGK